MSHPHYLRTRARLNGLINQYLSIEQLSDRLSDLPSQFETPHQRHWEPIHWHAIDRSQVIDVDLELFLKVIASAAEVEAPIRAYAKESWDYFHALHPQMATFMGGTFAEDGSTLTLGIWEKEERQHAPVFRKLYQQLTTEAIVSKPNSVSGCQPTPDPWYDLHHHVLSRLATEWSAVAVYLWLMAHSTGELQRAIAQPLQDEVNHLAKFWGFSRWAFADSYYQQVKGSTANLAALLKHHRSERTYSGDLVSKTRRLNNAIYAIELAAAFVRVMARLRRWDRELSNSYLRHLFGPSPAMAHRAIAA
ncbi:MAG: hypothetical protein ACAF41_34760 (plasmid) [Leptolyngbya sp. BL-A-14]